MNIQFLETKKYSIDSESGGVDFWVNVDNKEIRCFISIEALQDYNPRSRNEDIWVLFELYKSDIRNIVEKRSLLLILK